MKKDDRDLYFADDKALKYSFDKFKSKCDSEVSEESLKCELQLSMIGDWERLKFNIDYNKFLEEARKLNMWSIVRNYSSWRESFNNNENIINIIKKAIKNAKHTI